MSTRQQKLPLPLQTRYEEWLKNSSKTLNDLDGVWRFLCDVLGEETQKSAEFYSYCHNFGCCGDKIVERNNCVRERLKCWEAATARDGEIISKFNGNSTDIITFMSLVYDGVGRFIENGNRFKGYSIEDEKRTSRIRIAIDSIMENSQ